MQGLAFLVGRWRGTGEWGGAPFACSSHVTMLFGRYVQIDVHAWQDGRPAHEERVIVHAGEDGGPVLATLYPDRGAVQQYVLEELVPGRAYRFVFVPPAGSDLSPQRWTVRRTDSGYDDVFEIAPGGGPFEVAVTCSYVPDGNADGSAAADERGDDAR